MDYYQKYIKYKLKYLKLVDSIEGGAYGQNRGRPQPTLANSFANVVSTNLNPLYRSTLTNMGVSTGTQNAFIPNLNRTVQSTVGSMSNRINNTYRNPFGNSPKSERKTIASDPYAALEEAQKELKKAQAEVVKAQNAVDEAQLKVDLKKPI